MRSLLKRNPYLEGREEGREGGREGEAKRATHGLKW